MKESFLSESELQQMYTLCKRGSLGQLVALSGLLQSLVELRVKEDQDSLSLLLDKYEKQK